MSLDTFMLERPLVPFNVLVDQVSKHYRQEVVRQAYRILFAVDFLGNPIGIVQNLTNGFSSFVTETASGNYIEGGKVGRCPGAAISQRRAWP